MKYERLTKRLPNGGVKIENKTQWAVLYPENYTGYDIEAKMMLRLAELEDKIENGTLVELPCKVGDTVWVIAKQGMDIYAVEKTTVWDFWFSTTENRFYPIDANEIPLEKVFLTKAEAEKQLKELRGEV